MRSAMLVYTTRLNDTDNFPEARKYGSWFPTLWLRYRGFGIALVLLRE
jgi:hypothetical protein